MAREKEKRKRKANSIIVKATNVKVQVYTSHYTHTQARSYEARRRHGGQEDTQQEKRGNEKQKTKLGELGGFFRLFGKEPIT